MNKEREKLWWFNEPHNQANYVQVNNELISELFLTKVWIL